MNTITISVIDTLNHKHVKQITLENYRSLLHFILEELYEDIGDCLGKGWCGTCMVKQLSTHFKESTSPYEEKLIHPLKNQTGIRLSCQITISKALNNTIWQIVDSRQFL